MNLEVILFDAAGTLIHLSKPVGEGYAEVARRHGIAADPAVLTSSFARCWRRTPPPNAGPNRHPEVAKPLPGEPNSTESPAKIGDDDERWWWQGLVESVFVDAGIQMARDRMKAYFEDLYAYYGQASAWQLYDEVPGVLDELAARSGLRLAIASNFDRRLRAVLRGHGLGDAFERIHISSELRASKPSPEFFHQIVAASEVPAQAHLHVGDDPELDWSAARSAGLMAFELDRSRSDLTALPVFLASRERLRG